MSLSPGKLKHMNAVSNKDGIIAAAAMDQRGSLAKSLASAKGVPQKDITDEMMQEFKTAVTRILTPYASAILLDPEWGLPASKARAKNAGLLLAYENSGYDNTQPGRLPDLLPHVSVKRIKEDMGADAVKILIYYTPFDDPEGQRHQARLRRTHRRRVRNVRDSRSSSNSSATIRKAATKRASTSRSRSPRSSRRAWRNSPSRNTRSTSSKWKSPSTPTSSKAAAPSRGRLPTRAPRRSTISATRPRSRRNLLSISARA